MAQSRQSWSNRKRSEAFTQEANLRLGPLSVSLMQEAFTQEANRRLEANLRLCPLSGSRLPHLMHQLAKATCD